MWTMLSDLRSQRFWSLAFRLALLVSLGLAVLLVAFTAFFILLPIVLIGGLGLHLYLRRKLRQAQARHPARRPSSADLVIEAEYTVVERR
ncbi:hypothetical protein [Microvirga roseola]|uniref:hypothetical protein n=1 Tax=Microvirga roseola TaxID=2883126 RepID=UPI001E2D9B82|nr:hypothetical protein [Microvirga roseola]